MTSFRPVELLACPYDHSPLESHRPGEFCCPLCGDIAEDKDGVIDFLPKQQKNHELREIQARDTTAHEYEARFSRLRNAIEIPPSLRSISASPEDLIVELGCGTGRITRQYAGKTLLTVAIDFSRVSLLRLRDSLTPDQQKKCLLVRADVSKLPLRSGVFSKAVSFQVLEHLPSRQLRENVLSEAARVLVPHSGELIFSVYNWSRIKKRDFARGRGNNTAKEGFHPIGGVPVYYYNFEKNELSQLLQSAGFSQARIRGLQMQIRGSRFLGPFNVAMDRFLSMTPLGIDLGHLLLATGRRL
jgi:SAM-dependent methyltransferase